MKSKPILIMLISILMLSLIAASAYIFLVKNQDKTENNKPSIDEIVKYSIDIPELTTNLMSDDYIRVAFKIETDGKKTKEELELRDFQVRNMILKQLSGMKAKDLQGTEGIVRLETTLEKQLNELLDQGKIKHVYITSIILQ